LTTCWGTDVVVGDPGAVVPVVLVVVLIVVVVVVVVDPGANAGVVVVVLDCANAADADDAADAGTAVRTAHTVIAAAAMPNPERETRARTAAREHPNCDRLKFISAPECA
jgi:hypothetical protein